MNDAVPVTAGWALWGKRPGTREDDSVLAWAGPFSQTDYHKILTRFTPGSAETRSEGPGSLPWVTISWAGVDSGLHLGIAIQEPGGLLDGVGRAITQTRYFCVPYPALADDPVSYYGLYQAVADLSLPAAGSEPIPLRLPRLDPAALADTVTEFGESAVASAAAVLLERPVCIVQSDSSALLDRLRYLDAVAALLPYGYRTKYTAATWSDSGTRHRIRLAFAARPRADAVAVTWRGAAEIPPDARGAAAYLAVLDQLRGRPPGQARVFDLVQVIAHLASDPEPQKFDQGGPAVTSLRDIDLPFLVCAAAQQGTADAADLRRVFERSSVTMLPPEGQRLLLECLIGLADPADWPLIRRWWDPVCGSDPAASLPALAAAGRRLLWRPSPHQVVADYLALAAEYRLEDHLLAALLAPDGGDPAASTAGLGYATQLVYDRVVATGQVGAPGQDGGYPQTQATLARYPAEACELLARTANSAAEQQAGIGWLRPVLPGQIEPFIVVATGSGQVDERALAQLASAGYRCAGALLRAADAAGRLFLALPGFVCWLAALREMDAAERGFWLQLTGRLEPRDDDAAAMAWTDLALLVLDDTPRFLVTVAGSRNAAAYNDCLSQAWPAVTAPGRADDAVLTAALARYLSRQRWTGQRAKAESVVDLARKLAPPGRRRRLAGAVSAGLAAAPDAARWRFAQDWLDQTRKAHPQATADGSLAALRDVAPGTRPGQLAKLCAQACSGGAEPAAAAAALAEAGAVSSGSDAVDLVHHLRHELSSVRADPKLAQAWLRRFTVQFADGAFGPQTALGFRDQMPLAARDEIWSHLDLIRTIMLRGPEQLRGRDRDLLADLDQFVKNMLQDGRPSRLASFFRVLIVGGRDQEMSGQEWQ